MTDQLTYQDLAALMKKGAGLTVDPDALERRPEGEFAEFGLDSLGLLGVVGELENRHELAMPPEADKCRTPKEFLELVNAQLAAGV
ncbi:acyl carrier protein [Streptomyces fuscigenes]|jgi:minimal PKS acyl carrier protein|uniref:acyl carrier protein n=1 Tax=Streptomyces fuscigenes TaxID=1528880 RepID=UPI001F3C8049|nr:acyl carrier protein [Streptomyces fuscigenes]MCF3962395.1 acyl carrier protein [Streptomyces fuscigenes]